MQRQRIPGSVPGPSIRAQYLACPVHEEVPCLMLSAPSICPPKLAGAALTSRVFCSLVRTHTSAKDVDFGLPDFCSALPWDGTLCPDRFEPLSQTQPPLPPLSPVTVQVQCSIAQRRASCPVHDPYAHSYSPSPPTRRLLFSSSEDSFPSLPSCRRGPDQLFPILFFSLQPSKPSKPSLRRPPTCLAVPFPPLVTATDPSFSSNGGKHLSKILQQ